MFLSGCLKPFVAVMTWTNTFNIVLVVFDVSLGMRIQQSAGIVQNQDRNHAGCAGQSADRA